MARPKAADKVDGEGLDLESIFNAEALNPALESLYSELGVENGIDSTVHISKINVDGNEYGVWKGDPESYDLEAIARKFGSGQYRVKVYVRVATGQKPCKANKVFFWQLSPEDEAVYQRAMKAALNPVDVNIQPQQQQISMQEMMQTMMAGFQSAIKEIVSVVNKPQENPMHTLQGLKELAVMFRPQEIKTDSQMDGLTKIIMAKAVEKLLDDKTPFVNEDGEVSPMNVLMRGIDVFGNAIAQKKAVENNTSAIQSSESINQIVQPVQPIQIIQPIQSDQPIMNNTIDINNDEIKQIAKDQTLMACAMARANISPNVFAKSIYDLAPDELIEMLYLPNWFEQLCIINPDCKEHEKWLDDCRNHVIELVNKDADLTDDDKTNMMAASESVNKAANGDITQ